MTESKTRIIVVDDSPDAVESLARLLHVMGHEVKTTTEPREALDLAKAFLPHIAFLDLGMPHIDGYQLARKGRAGATLTIVAVGSFVGGTLAVIGVMMFSSYLAQVAILFGPAEFFERTDIGNLNVGSKADIVLLDANPLEDIGNVRRIQAVILAGELLTRSQLDTMLIRVKTQAAAK